MVINKEAGSNIQDKLDKIDKKVYQIKQMLEFVQANLGKIKLEMDKNGKR